VSLAAGVYDAALNANAVLVQYASLMDYLANKVWQSTREMHQDCPSPIRFETVPVNYDDGFYHVKFLMNIDKDAYDFLIVPPLQSACLSAYGVVHLLTRVRNNKAISKGEVPVGGLIFTRAGNPEINTFEDLKDKVVRTAG
jgi:hypothetical protein